MRHPSLTATATAVVCALLVVLGLGAVPTLSAQVQGPATYLYTLADFGGPLRYDGVRVSVDQETDETYIVYQNIVHIFNASGMEVFSFGEDLDLGQIVDVAVDKNGDILLLSFKDNKTTVTRCNFRGVPIGPIEFKHFPEGMELSANRMIYRGGLLYLASLSKSSVVVTDTAGEFKSFIEFPPLLQPEERKDGAGAFGVAVDADGSIFMTMPTIFRVFKRTTDGTLTSFGRSGSAPGQFGIVSGVATDTSGNLFIADKLKCVVMVFDKNFKFVTEFGYRGAGAENLIIPDDVAADKRGRIYVSQWRRRGVSVFSMALR